MADVFISYARADRARAERLAHVLGEQGWSVWWDRYIPPGKTFDDVIEDALAEAKCVIVLWSQDSVRSEWVKAEASEAARRRILVPILADDIRIPLEFRRIQTARLIDWANLPANRDWDQLSQALAALLGREVKPRATAVPEPKPARRLSLIGGVAAAIVLALALTLTGYSNWHRKDVTRIEPDAASHVSPPQDVARPDPTSAVPTPDRRHEPAPVVAPKKSEPPVRHLPSPRVETRTPDNPQTPNTVEIIGAAVAPAALPSSVTVRNHIPQAAKGSDETTFAVTYMHGVFRREAGRLRISADGVRYEDTAGGAARASFELSCGEVRKVDIPNVIVDPEQRTLELRVRDRSYRLGTANRATRDEIVSAVSNKCGTH
jgi:hypothetical protein